MVSEDGPRQRGKARTGVENIFDSSVLRSLHGWRKRGESLRNAHGCVLAVCFVCAAASARSRRSYLRVVPAQQGAIRIQHVEWDESRGPVERPSKFDMFEFSIRPSFVGGVPIM